MADRFYEFFNDELTALRHRATRFAEAYPKIAGRLRLARDTTDDPHVERLIQSFAFTAARVRQKLDDSLPELTDSLLETLYPHYLAPFPAITVVQFTPSEAVEAEQVLPRHSELTAEPVGGDACRFRTTQPVPLLPLRVEAVQLMARPIEAPQIAGINAAGAVRITLAPGGRQPIHALGFARLRFYLRASQRQAAAFQALLHNHTVAVALAAHSADEAPQILPRAALRPLGFADDEALIPYQANSFTGYRTLTEFFGLPEKFQFFEVETGAVGVTDRLDIYLYVDCAPGPLERGIGRENLLLNCTPIVNLFPTRAEPVPLDGTRTIYPLLADARRPRSNEVHSVTAVTLIDKRGETRESRAFFHRLTDRGERSGEIYWQLQRHAESPEGVPGTVSVAFVDERDRPRSAADTVASVEILATNGDLPDRLPYVGGQPYLTLNRGADLVASIACLMPPTPIRRRGDPDDRAWRLISHLSLNHLSIVDDGVAALRSILRLYDSVAAPETRRMIDAIHDVRSEPAVVRLGETMLRGTEIVLTLDEEQIEPGQGWLFASALDRFFGAYTTINSFTRLTLRFKGLAEPYARFAPRAGQEPLL
ncbi:MAG: type VI secretion system baseplate subunit TssF [Pseudomonadota bacterium]